MATKLQADDAVFNSNWNSLLKIFHSIESGSGDKKPKYQALKELAKTKTLTYNQAAGISERCDYQISLIEDKNQIPFANSLRTDIHKTLDLGKTESNGHTKN